MPNHKSAEKRVRQNAKRRARNRQVMSMIRTETKQAREAMSTGAENVTDQFNNAIRALSRAAAKGYLHHNTAARKISRLAKALHASQSTVNA